MQYLSWRQKAHVRIAEVQHDNPGVRGDELRKLLKSHYPFYQRRYYPYKMWCAAVTEVCGPTPAQRTRLAKRAKMTPAERKDPPLPLFD